MSATTTSPGDGTGRSDVVVRLLVAPVVLAVVLGVLAMHDRFGEARWSDGLLALFGAGAAIEFARLLGADRRTTIRAAILSAALAGVGLLAPDGTAARFTMRSVLVAAGVVAPLLVALRDVRPDARGLIAGSFVPWLYVGFLLSFVREVADGPDGARRLAFVVLVAKASDVGGWVVGKSIGRRKMIPSVSPGKTWEGTAGGLLASALFAATLPELLRLAPESAWPIAKRIAFGGILAAASIVAGITQSGWKRRARVKHLSGLIPHMGGMLDMVDSLLLAGPVAWAWYRLLS